MDETGLKVEELAYRLETLKSQGKKASFLYVIPSFQNPTGITLSEERRKALVDLVDESELLVVEDDVYCDLSYEEHKVTTLYSLDKGKNVLRIGSFSKILAPGLRMGWILGPEEHIDSFVDSGLRTMGGGANPVIANVLSVFCERDLLDSHIESLKRTYRERRDVMLDTMGSQMPENIRWTKPGGGFFVWITLPQNIKAADVVDKAKAEGVLILPGDPFFAESPTGQYLRLAFSYIEADKIKEGVEKLANLLKSYS